MTSHVQTGWGKEDSAVDTVNQIINIYGKISDVLTSNTCVRGTIGNVPISNTHKAILHYNISIHIENKFLKSRVLERLIRKYFFLIWIAIFGFSLYSLYR